jgi:hypothetical protein
MRPPEDSLVNNELIAKHVVAASSVAFCLFTSAFYAFSSS